MKLMKRSGATASLGKRLLELAVVFAVICAVEWLFFGFRNIDFSVPVLMSGDGIGGVIGVKSVLSDGEFLRGWPFFSDTSKYSAKYGFFNQIVIWIASLFTKDYNVIFNLFIFSIPLLNAMVCYMVLRHFKVREWIALISSACFGFCPYVQFRMGGHTSLATIYSIPIVFMLCIWCLEDPNYNRPCKGWFKDKRNWATLALTWFIADTGMVYYPFFACFVFLVTAIFIFIKERKIKAAVSPLMLIVQVACWLGIMFIPTVVGYFKGYGNVASAGVARTPGAGMVFSMRLNSMLLSPKGYGSSRLAGLIGSFNQYAMSSDSYYNENAQAYMGVVGVIGFFLLLVVLIAPHGKREENNDPLGNRLWLLSVISIAVVILGVQSGIGTIVNIFVADIRCYNRISPFLVFTGVFAVTLCFEFLLRRVKADKKTALFYFAPAVIGAILIYGLWEQKGIYLYYNEGDSVSRSQIYDTDEAFVDQIEASAGEEGLIFQLPYMRSFENGPQMNISDYDHNRGAFHSETLRWSYGAAIGSENDEWYRMTSSLPAGAMVEELYKQGFSGIWLNLAGYTEQDGEKLKEELCAAAHCDEPILCGDGHTVYIPLSYLLCYHTDTQTGEIERIDYTASNEVIETILDELYGSDKAVSYLKNALDSNGIDGNTYSIEIPKDSGIALVYRTPDERKLQAVDVVVDLRDFILYNNGSLQEMDFPMTIKENTIYRVDIILDEDVSFDAIASMVVDFCAGPDYDRMEQESHNFIKRGVYHYTFYFDSGVYDGEQWEGYVRTFVYDISSEVKIYSLTVTEMFDFSKYSDYREGETVVSVENTELNDYSDCQLLNCPIILKENTPYLIKLVLGEETDLDSLDDLIVDFYGGEGYDSLEQQKSSFIREEVYSYTLIIDSGVLPTDLLGTEARVLTYDTDTSVYVDSFTVTELVKD